MPHPCTAPDSEPSEARNSTPGMGMSRARNWETEAALSGSGDVLIIVDQGFMPACLAFRRHRLVQMFLRIVHFPGAMHTRG